MSSKTYNSTYLIAPDNSCSYPLNRRLCDPRTVWTFSRKEISFPLSRIRPQSIRHPAQAVTTQTVLYWLRPTQYSCLVRNCAQQLCLQSAAKNTWSLHTFQPDICNQPDHILCTCVVGMLWVVPQCFTSHRRSYESGHISLAQHSNVWTVLKVGSWHHPTLTSKQLKHTAHPYL